MIWGMPGAGVLLDAKTSRADPKDCIRTEKIMHSAIHSWNESAVYFIW
ncbi:MAG: hypothetical protein VX278_19900 [Myxococcota bacterium]|nr:hypothetical protein [Myxococcota bacterium]